MIHTRKIKTETSVATGFTCDRCKKMYDSEDTIEWQERLSVSLVGGFGCVYGDGMSVKFDLCQHCLIDVCENFARFNMTIGEFNHD